MEIQEVLSYDINFEEIYKNVAIDNELDARYDEDYEQELKEINVTKEDAFEQKKLANEAPKEISIEPQVEINNEEPTDII